MQDMALVTIVHVYGSEKDAVDSPSALILSLYIDGTGARGSL